MISPTRLSIECDTDALLAEAAADESLLDEFYAFMYERAVLVGSGASPSKDSSKSTSNVGGGDSVHATSPRRGAGSPRKHLVAGPPATSLSAASVTTTSAAASVVSSALLPREIMNAILPPKSWRDAAGTWQRMVKLTHATRSDAVQLEDALNRLLASRQARATAICHVREQLFLQVFETIIRDVACESPERGLLLLRVRDELRLTIDATQTLYHNSIAYGRAKAVQAEAGIADLEARAQQLEQQRAQLEAEKTARTLDAHVRTEQRAEQERKRLAAQAQTRRFLDMQHQELETFVHALAQDTLGGR